MEEVCTGNNKGGDFQPFFDTSCQEKSSAIKDLPT
jgi:hypothetical protein